MVIHKSEKDKVRALLVEAITVLCKNGLGYKKELCVEGLLGITLDKEDVFLVHIQQTFATSDAEVSEADSDERQSTESGKRKRRRRKVSGKKRTMSDRSDDGESADESYNSRYADVSNRLSESGGEPREKRHAVDRTNECLAAVKQEPVDEVSDDEDLVFVKSDPGEGGFEGGGGDNQYSMSAMPNLSTNIPLNYEGPGCSSWDNSTSSLNASGTSLDASAAMTQGEPLPQIDNQNISHKKGRKRKTTASPGRVTRSTKRLPPPPAFENESSDDTEAPNDDDDGDDEDWFLENPKLGNGSTTIKIAEVRSLAVKSTKTTAASGEHSDVEFDAKSELHSEEEFDVKYEPQSEDESDESDSDDDKSDDKKFINIKQKVKSQCRSQ